ncbi:MAG TPA: isoleucine--tRNA ligase [Tepidisphaeraceae bacterium]|jgi:isoleucyl-tRNA synthetase
MSTDTKKSYKETLNLPQTAFPMEAKLVANEPARLKAWQEADLYGRLMESRASAPAFVLHDGPPFANGDIHMGHLTNKTLKDVILRYKSLAGFRTPYVPGWDCHGLPIEHKIQQDLGKKFREMSAVEVRQQCAAYAQKYATLQGEQFQRLGILGDWANPYLTMAPSYEAATLEVFAQVVERGLVYKQLKTVPWSIANQTALADAELEYQDVADQSVYVEFPVANPGAFKAKFDLRVNAKVSLLIWTTTPWTLPANLAIAANPDVEYAIVQYARGDHYFITVVAAPLAERVFAKANLPFHVVQKIDGKQLIDLEYTHPFIDRTGRVLAADYVTTTDGTGLVHTAPGHGEDDYNTGVKNGLEVYSPVQSNGRYDSTVPNWLVGLTVWEANPKIVDKLREDGHLFAEETITHSYPHDWRSKTKIIFRATEQWFVAVTKPAFPIADATNGQKGSVRDLAYWSSITRDEWRGPRRDPEFPPVVEFNPPVQFWPMWGANRFRATVQSRPDWCISRQRSWGLPIPVFYNENGEALLTPQSVRAVASKFAEHGSDAWFTMTAAELLGDYDPGASFPKDKLRKEQDIFDVWFESGSSWNAVLKARPDILKFPADLYLEGSDQHRGWFQLSMLACLASGNGVPYETVVTHGFIVGPDGKKVSKSDKNYVTATQEVNRHGADLLRLFVCSGDYEGDMAASPKMIQEFGDKYRKIRNTLRYLLSNLYDYDGSRQEVTTQSLDGWALAQLDTLIADVTAAYESYALHRAFRLIHDFCAVQISSLYGNAMKDRMYCDAPDSPLRRRTQYVMHQMVLAVTKLVSPMLVFTADEAWGFIPHKPHADAELASVHLSHLPRPSGREVSGEQLADWGVLMKLREEALMKLDALKKEKGVNKSSDAEVIYPKALQARLEPYGVDLEDMVGCGYHSFGDVDSVMVIDRRETYAACARSWKRRPDVGSDAAYPDLCARDAAALASRG